MGGHSRPNDGESNEWYTPPEVFDALGVEFDLDPCAPQGGVEWVPTKRWLSRVEDGLATPWDGFVWMNPPYGQEVGRWMSKLRDHGDGIALVFARTDTAWFHDCVPDADLVCFVRGRFFFRRPDGSKADHNSGAPSMLVAYGERGRDAVSGCGLGHLMEGAR